MTRLKVQGYVLPILVGPDGSAQWNENFSMDLPGGAQLLQMDALGPQCVLYALVDPKAGLEQRDFRLVESNSDHALDAAEHLAYVGSFATADRAKVFHLFECVSSAVQIPTVGKKVH